MIWQLLLAAFIAWGVAPFPVSLHETESGVAGAAPLRDGTCGIFIGPSFYVMGIDQASVMIHEVGHCLSYDDLGAGLTPEIAHPPWFESFEFRLTVAI